MISGHENFNQIVNKTCWDKKKSSSKLMILINLISTKLLELVRNAALISRIVQTNPCNTHISLKLLIGYKDLVETHFEISAIFLNPF